ncbi:NRDE family protein [Arenicella xantha]|nr:NRDE family protein [Arenicella xantha]
MTWFTADDGYELFFNRDERLSRRRAEPPSVKSDGEVHYLSPTDADAGGTWIAVNAYGVTVCLLNHYQFEQIATYKDWISRGEIVRYFAETEDVSDIKQRFFALNLHDFRAFRMFIVDRSGRNYLCVWDGHTPRVEQNVRTPKSSSSVDARHVKSVRRDLFNRLDLAESQNSSDYVDYHSSHLPSRSKESVCMHRDDAKTVSLSHVRVSESGIEFRYADGSPCEVALSDPIHMSFARQPNSSTDACCSDVQELLAAS